VSSSGRATVAALALLVALASGCEGPAAGDEPAASVEQIANRLGEGRESSRLPALCPDIPFGSVALPVGTPVYRAVLGSERNPVPVRFHVLDAPEQAQRAVAAAQEAAGSCRPKLEDVSSAGGYVSSETVVEDYHRDGWRGVAAVARGRRGPEESGAALALPFTVVSAVAARGVVLAEVSWNIDGRSPGRDPDPDWEKDGREEVARLLREVGGDPSGAAPQKPDPDSPVLAAMKSLPPLESYGTGTSSDPSADFLVNQPCGLGSQVHYPHVAGGTAQAGRTLAGPEAHVEEVVVLHPSRRKAREYLQSRLTGIERFGRMPHSCFGYGHPLQLPLDGATVVPYVEQKLEIDGWEGTIGSAAARLRGAPPDATIANSQVWAAAAVRNGEMVASVTLFARAGDDLSTSIAEKRQQVERVLRGMVAPP
jgi:hypothetical protein